LGSGKGYCLAATVEILSCVFRGANCGPFVPPCALRQKIPARSVGKEISHAIGAIRFNGFIDPPECRQKIDDWVQPLRATRPTPEAAGVVNPGDPERQAERRVTGIPLLPEGWPTCGTPLHAPGSLLMSDRDRRTAPYLWQRCGRSTICRSLWP
jgi:LDH2 family malate/lactate/ureidoglycolate dehydrogenase